MTTNSTIRTRSLTKEQSETIKIARVLCIFLMTYVHVHPWESALDLAQYGVRTWDVMRFYVVEAFGRSSVALLSAVSGFLLVMLSKGESHSVLVGRKARTLLLPMAIWNLTALALMAGYQTLAGKPADLPSGSAFQVVRQLLDASIALTNWPQMTPLAFLRDLFVCALLSPLLIRLVRWSAPAALALAFVYYAADLRGVVILRPSILFFFTIGLAAALHGPYRLPSWPVRTAIGMMFLAVPLLTVALLLDGVQMPRESTLLHALRMTQRILSVGAVLFLAVALARSAVGPWLGRLEPYVFFLFCSHTLVFSLFWDLWRPAFGGYYAPGYPVFFLMAPVAAFGLAIVGMRILDWAAPGLLAVINGGRTLTRRKRAVAEPAIASPGAHTVEKPARIIEAG